MSSHPDADAFVRAFIRNPKDETTRLVFADWLDDAGGPHNTAWAGYIRAKAAGARFPFGGPEWRASDDEAAEFAADVAANLTLPVGFFLGYPASLLRLLPGPNITVRLGGVECPRNVTELMPESVARENVALALQLQQPVLLIAAHEPGDAIAIRKMTRLFGRDLVAVRAGLDDLLVAINSAYGKAEVETMDISYESPLVGLEGDRDSWACGSLFVQAFMRQAAGFELERVADGCRGYYLPRAGRTADEDFPRSVFSRLHDHLTAQPVEHRSVAGGVLRREVDVPLLSGRRFPIDFEVRQGEQPPSWLRVEFRWERREL